MDIITIGALGVGMVIGHLIARVIMKYVNTWLDKGEANERIH